MSKIGRNQQCPCGSGKKYKRCHGGNSNFLGQHVSALPKQNQSHYERIKAKELQRQKLQGLGHGIDSTELGGTRTVVINGKVMQSDNWWTFADFLADYICITTGRDWGYNEICNRSEEERHPIVKWSLCFELQQKKYATEPGVIYRMPETGVIKAYIGLAYDLYCLEHNAGLQKTLLERLKISDSNFHGVRYEIAVAAMMIRGGFKLEFEDESDRRTTHCEFTATSSCTGKKFSVECKRLESSSGDGRINLRKLGKRFVNALEKKAKHERIVFIDLNFPYDPKVNTKAPEALTLARNHINKFEHNVQNGGHLPPAFVFLTNAPYEYHLEDESVQFFMSMDSFKIPEAKVSRPCTLREAIDTRDKYFDIDHLLKSIRRYSEIPSTFDGELPEFAYDKDLNQSRLLIGEEYQITDENDEEVVGVLEQAVVVESENEATCILKAKDGRRLQVTFPLSEKEIRAYKRSPDTFFGTVGHVSQRTDNPLDLFDFFYETHKEATKESLLDHFKGFPDFHLLHELSQPELVKQYAKQLTELAMRVSRPEEDKS